MDKEVFAQPETGRGLQANFVAVKLNADEAPATARLYGVTSLPADVILTPRGQLVAQLQSPPTSAQYINQLNQLAAGFNRMHQTEHQANMPPSAIPAAQQAYAPASGAQPPMPSMATQMPATPMPGMASSTPGMTPSAPPSPQWPQMAAAPQQPLDMSHGSGAPMGAAPMGPGSMIGPSAAPQAPAGAAASQVAAAMPPGSPPLGLDGYCPVQLVQHRRWTQGDPRWGAIHQGHTYLFAGPEEQKIFLANPNAYGPVLAGSDPVRALDDRQNIEGRREHGVYYENRVYLFADEASRERFSQNPKRYAAEVVQAMR